ncbi:ABC transporter permease [Burkholderia cepacia]|nr:ABC transporter permease [Burkholderia cepacia]MBH9697341.1 ABC transporter permease [Burkholderia cepacia]MBH9713489.1 ABC transporter permease [Burkholderia cepacia]MBH9734125.1 ABC transporter permease [Burkholderia cepacia]MBX3764865.1 ABC transporter permease [Burkholderia cepacia]
MWRAFSVQRRVIGALLMRESLTRYGRHNIGFLWIFMEPLLYTTGVYVLWKTFDNAHLLNNVPMAAFALTGYSQVLLWRSTASRCSKAIEPNLSLLYHRHVRVLDIFIARIILEIAGITASFFGLALIFWFVGLMPAPIDLGVALIGWLSLAWLGAAFGLLVGALTEKYDVVEKMIGVVMYFMMPVSGCFFMVEWLPRSLQQYALLMPTVSGLELLRDGFYGDKVTMHYDITYLIFTNLLLTLIALSMSIEVSKRVEPE